MFLNICSITGTKWGSANIDVLCNMVRPFTNYGVLTIIDLEFVLFDHYYYDLLSCESSFSTMAYSAKLQLFFYLQEYILQAQIIYIECYMKLVFVRKNNFDYAHINY